ncbi:MAG TPA: helix-turn-helix domain-containing protein [Puia sp.]|uniref:helix-turn-helix domain-containing protein n=1 Tax=Puia sp. TaxID=2045100 RepID=UPI002D165CCF|nr:helix-turn-helix domain-containing protein [Puia sp.]HVU94409.1 helix-turn-helix domain-containing protein [Puia sp.]
MPVKIVDHNVKRLSYSVNARQYSSAGDRVTVPFNRNGLYKIWLIHNPCRLFINDEIIVCQRPVLFFANPLVSYAYDSLQDQRSGYWCVFTKEFLATHDPFGRMRNYPALAPAHAMLVFPEPEQLAAISILFRQLTAAIDAPFTFRNEMIVNYIQALLFEGMKTDQFPPPQPDAATRITRQFLQLLQSQFPIHSPERPMPLQKPGDFARRLSIQVNHLNATIRTTTGQTTTQHIANSKIAEAKSLLRHSDWTIAAIGESLGFNYPNHFNRFFKQNTGSTPLQYRTKRIL